MSAEDGLVKRGLTRRRALGLAGLAGAAYVAGPLRPFASSDGGATDPSDAGAAATCVLAPEVTEGPYWVDVKENRSDIVGGQSGVPLSLDLYVYRSDDSCEPEQGAIVDIWHCNAQGIYSDEAIESTAGQTWLRGYQETDSSGKASFQTIYPSWYVSRTIHIHVRVRTFSGSSTTYNFTTQIFFEEANNQAVLATSPYSSRSNRDTTNSADGIYQQEARAGNVLIPTLSGNTTTGYSGTVGIGLSGLPATASGAGSSSESSGSSSGSSSSGSSSSGSSSSGSSSSGSSSSGSSSSGSSSSGSTAADTAVAARLLRMKFLDTGARRELELKLEAEEKISAKAELLRGGRTIARKKVAALTKGRRSVAVVLPGGVEAGHAHLRLTLTDRAGNSRVINRGVRVPAA